MTRPIPIAASLALVVLSFAAFAQTPPASGAPAPAQAPASSATAPMATDTAASAPVSAPAPAAAAPATPAALTGSAARGGKLAYTCQGCHGVTGYKNAYPNFHVPRIGGQAKEYLTYALGEYKSGARKHPTMQAQAESFSDQDIADIAAFLSGLKP